MDTMVHDIKLKDTKLLNKKQIMESYKLIKLH